MTKNIYVALENLRLEIDKLKPGKASHSAPLVRSEKEIDQKLKELTNFGSTASNQTVGAFEALRWVLYRGEL